jgi:hypothetical protein
MVRADGEQASIPKESLVRLGVFREALGTPSQPVVEEATGTCVSIIG